MKYLLILAIAFLIIWIWKSNRREERREAASEKSSRKATRQAAQLAPTEIVACDVCQVHLPRSEALIGPDGIYCSAEHRQQAGH